MAACTVSALPAPEHHGLVTFHGLPVPGAVVTAIQGGQKFTTSTDDDGTYSSGYVRPAWGTAPI
jgi:hypothetical protein